MSSLQRKIKQLEASMNAEKALFIQNGLLLKERVIKPQFLVGAGASVGFLGAWIYRRYTKQSVNAAASKSRGFMQILSQHLLPAIKILFPLLLA